MNGDVLTLCFFFFQAEDGIRDYKVTGVQTCALPISLRRIVISFLDRPSLLRRPAWGRVAGREPSRVIAIRRRAWLASRPPPGLSRRRGAFPRGAGGGAAPRRGAPGAPLGSRPGGSPPAIRDGGGVSRPGPGTG